MTGRLSVALLILSASVAVAQDNPSFKATVSLVRVQAEVTDGTKLLAGFEKDDFQVLDNAVPQPILYFSHDLEPLDLILLFDVSGSMSRKLQKVADSAHAALSELRPGDRVAIMIFTRQSSLVLPFTDDLDAVERSMSNDVIGKARGGTRILHAIDDAARYYLSQPRTERRRAVLIVTDNHGQLSGRKSTVVRNLWEADAVVSGLVIRSPGETAMLTISKITSPQVAWLQAESMTGVSEQTGGDLINGPDPGESFHEAIRRIRLRYTLYYAMPQGKPGERRLIKVALSEDAQKRNPQARVRARTGYYVPKSEPASR